MANNLKQYFKMLKQYPALEMSTISFYNDYSCWCSDKSGPKFTRLTFYKAFLKHFKINPIHKNGKIYLRIRN